MNTIKKFVLFLAVTMGLFLLTDEAFAKKEFYYARKSGSAISGTLTAFDNQFNFMMTNRTTLADYFLSRSVRNVVKLSIERNGTTIPADFTTTMTLRISGQIWDEPTKSFISRTLPNITLRVTNAAVGGSIDQATYLVESFSQFHIMNVEVVSVTGPKESLMLEASIEIDRVYKLNIETKTTIKSVAINSNNDIIFNWDAVMGAEAYDLEWAYFDDASFGGLSGTSVENIEIPANYFKNKSTRITTAGLRYSIPAIYEKGFILYRIRAVGSDASGQYIYCNWSFEQSPAGSFLSAVPYIRLDTHQANLNWQSVVSYSEGGKSNVSVNYFDGALYNRQQVTKINSNDKVKVAETIYDHVGRPAIATLPVPANTPKVGFIPKFNRNSSGSAYNKSNFQTNQAIVKVPDPMRTDHDGIGGASNYFSDKNPDVTSKNAFLPDAKGYPFSQTEYTPDATGRIRRQSIPGTDFKIGSNHESKFYYGKPFQAELDRLFGNDIGHAEHYNKVLKIDGNGNISGTYNDEAGRVIATFLAGNLPSNMEDVTSPGESRSVTIDVLNKQSAQDNSGSTNKLSQDGMSRSVNQDFVVTDLIEYTLNYELRTNKYTDVCEITTPQLQMCYDCVLDVKVRITDENGTEVLPALPGTTNNNATVGDQSLNCTTTPKTLDATVTTARLEPGNYKITKILTVNRAALDRYVQDYLVRSQQCKTFEDFLEEETAQIDLSGCDLDCESCRTQVGTFDKYSGPNCSPCLTLSEYEKLLQSCNELCNTTGRECEIAYQSMLQDMSPGGQYAEFIVRPEAVVDGQVVEAENQVAGDVFDPTKFPLSIFNRDNKLPLAMARQLVSWKNPQFVNSSGQTVNKYFDANGAEAFVNVMVVMLNGLGYVTTPGIDPSMYTPLPGLKPGDIIKLPPQALGDAKDFIAQWQESWAKSLIKYHPEYPSLVYCKSLQASHDFDLKLSNTGTIAEATQKGFTAPDGTAVNFLGANSGVAVDPYFKNDVVLNPAFNQTEYDKAKTKFNSYMTDPGTTSGTAREMRIAAHFIANCPEAGQSDAQCNSCPTFNGVNTDAEWNVYKNLYISMKQAYQEDKRTKQSIVNKSYNGCIGDVGFNPFRYGFFSLIGNNAYIDNTQPCSHFTRVYYADKISRFQTSSQLLNSSEEQDECRLAVINSNDAVNACVPVLNEIIDGQRKDSEKKLFESCGECPSAVHLQTILNAIAQRDGLDSDDIQLSCYPASKYPEFSSVERILAQSQQGTAAFLWDFNVSQTNSQEFVANIGRGVNNPNECEIKLRLLENVPQFSFASVTGICCINHTLTPQIYPLVANRNFTIVANYIDPATQQQRQVKMEGVTSCFDIAGCTFVPECEANLRAKNMQTMLAALAFDFDINPNTPTDLVNVNKTTNLLGAPYTNIVNGAILRNDFGATATWSVTIPNSNTLIGVVQGANGLRWQIELTKTSGTFGFENIIRVASIKVNADAQDPTRGFILWGSAKIGNAESRMRLNGYSNLVVAGCTPVTFGVVNNGLVGHWPLNGALQDISGKGIHGAMRNSGGFSLESQEGGGSLSLNGTNQYVDLIPALTQQPNPPQLPVGLAPRSLSVWTMTNTIAAGFAHSVAYGKAVNGKAFFIGRNGSQLVAGGYGSDFTVNNFWQVGVWHHLCLTYDGVTAKLYSDGIEVASGARNWPLEFERAYIGRQVNNAEHWNGLIDDVRIYNRVLSADEIQNIKFSGL